MMMHDVLLYSLAMGSAGCVVIWLTPGLSRVTERVAGRLGRFQQGKISQASRELDELFLDVKPSALRLAYGLGPLAAGVAAFLAFNRVELSLLTSVAGIVAVDAWVKQVRAARRRRFRAQIVDALFMISSSLRAGLSMRQAFEVVESEMSPPASQEFGLVLRAHRLGLALEEALQGMHRRMACEELQLFITAVEVTKETGGNVTTLVAQLITTIREARKLKEKVSTLTLQGRLQAYVMSALPVVFAVGIHGLSPAYFQPLTQDPSGRAILAIAVALWGIGMGLLFRMSRIHV